MRIEQRFMQIPIRLLATTFLLTAVSLSAQNEDTMNQRQRFQK
jgi:hypothetical protein